MFYSIFSREYELARYNHNLTYTSLRLHSYAEYKLDELPIQQIIFDDNGNHALMAATGRI
jgi:hypothetical protein